MSKNKELKYIVLDFTLNADEFILPVIGLNDLLDSDDLVVKYYVSKSFYRTAPISVKCYLYFFKIQDIALFKLKYGL